MTAGDLGRDVLVSVGPLIKDAGAGGAEVLQLDAAYVVAARAVEDTDVVLRKAEGFLRIVADLIPAPAGGIDASLVQEGGREGVVPYPGEGIVNLRMMIEIVGTLGAVVARIRGGNPVDGKAGVILDSDISVETAVVLFLRVSRRVERHILRDVGHAIKP